MPAEHLTETHKKLIRYLYNLKSEVFLSEISDDTKIDRKNLWKALNYLVEKRLASTEQEKPGLPKFVVLTEKGMAYAEVFCNVSKKGAGSATIRGEVAEMIAKMIPSAKDRNEFYDKINRLLVQHDLFDDKGQVVANPRKSIKTLYHLSFIQELADYATKGKVADKALLKDFLESHRDELVKDINHIIEQVTK